MKKRWPCRIYLGRDENGKQQFHWVGYFDSRREREEAKAEARLHLKRGGSPELPTIDDYVDRYLLDYGRKNKDSSLSTQTGRLKRFRKDFAGRSLDLPRAEVKDWANSEGRWIGSPSPIHDLPAVVSLFNHAINEDDLPLSRNPARGLTHRSKGRAEEAPPTEEEFQALLDGCSVLKDYAPTMRALMLFGAFTLMRPGEIYPLEWADLDFTTMRIRKARRLYRGSLAEPKTGPKTIALTPPARDAIMGLSRESNLVFTSKTGERLSQGAVSNYWLRVQAAAGLTFPFYLATKHYGVHYMWTVLKMTPRAIAAQAGWSLRTVERMLAVYGHGDVGALDEVDQAFKNAQTPGLRVVEGGMR